VLAFWVATQPVPALGALWLGSQAPAQPAAAASGFDFCAAAISGARVQPATAAVQQEEGHNQAIYARHTVLMVPTDASPDAFKIAASAYSILPRKDGAGELSSHFTKVALVGLAPPASSAMSGVLVGDEVCGSKSSTIDQNAQAFFQANAKDYVTLLTCAQVSTCSGGPALSEQLPFIETMFSGGGVSGRSLQGNFLPIIMQQQSIDFGVAVGDAVNLLVAPGGIWEGERVLLVFSGDIRPQISWPGAVENEVTLLAEQGVGNAVRHYDRAAPGNVPKDYSVFLAAAQVSGLLGMHSSRSFLGGGDSKTGAQYASIIKWIDDRWIGERMALTEEAQADQSKRKHLLRQNQRQLDVA